MLKTNIFINGRMLVAVLALVGLAAAHSANAQLYPMDSRQGMPGEELFPVCSFCHGAEGQGGPALDAPALAGMEAWYVERQLHNFRNRTRGMHYEDVPGVQMSIVSGMVRNDATIKNIAEYIEDMEPGAAPELARGEPAGTARPFIWRSKYAELIHPDEPDVAKGEEIYTGACIACHGINGNGNVLLGAPKLVNQTDWYMERQLQYFKDGIRGADLTDIYGPQMAIFAKTLAGEQAIADVVAYIMTL
jgi:cytochrome c oxidase subunit 2